MIEAAPTTELRAAQSLAAELKRRWRRGDVPSAAAALAEHPELASFKSIVIDLAYEEYLLREQAGQAPEPEEFSDQFPRYRASIAKTIGAHQLLLEQPELLDPKNEPSEWPEVGSQVEGLEILSVLGKGTFGRAYLAYDPGIDRLCALKLAAGGLAEAKVIGRLAHPHVTDVYWARSVGRRTAVCMPFVGVSTLADVIAAAFPKGAHLSPVPADVILEVAEADGLAAHADRRSARLVRPGEAYLVGACAVGARIADAVAYLHEQRIAHGDLKPSNVVIGPGGAPHLIDFNLSTNDARSASMRGTLAYMAPEVVDGMLNKPTPGGVDTVKVDLFALGVVLYELLTGRLPYPLPTAGKLDDLADAPRRGPPAFTPQIPQTVARIISACLAADPARRPASAREVTDVLDRYVRAARTRRRRLVQAVLAVACCLGVVTLTGIGFATRPEPAPLPERAPVTAEDYFQRGLRSLHSGEAGQVADARTDFNRAHMMSKDPLALAYLAYCMTLTGRHADAADMGKQAIRDGLDTAEVHNIVGYSLAKVPPFTKVLEHYSTALERDNSLHAARYNRAMFELQQSTQAGGKPLENPRCAEDITTVLASGLSSRELHLEAARIYAACLHFDPKYRGECLTQVRKAISAGYTGAFISQQPLLKEKLVDDPQFTLICTTTPTGQAPDRPPQFKLVEPRRGK